MNFPTPLRVLLADDDRDDRFFFTQALEQIPIPTHLTTVVNGEKLMSYLSENLSQLPDVLFLDQNMPCKSGLECLTEIELNKKLKHLPIVIYSSSLHKKAIDLFYEKGAHYYMVKTDLEELIETLQYILSLIAEKNISFPSRENFVVSLEETALQHL